MREIRSYILQENRLVFLFCFAVIIGPAISTLFAFDITQLKDCETYLGLANFDFDQSPVRRFRLIIPLFAALLNFLLGSVFNKLAPTYFIGDFGLPFSFFIINTSLMSLYGLLIYRYCKAYGINTLFVLIGILVMLTSRYTIYFSALPLVDSLFCVTVAMSLLGIKEKNQTLLIAAIFIGPFAKEAFIFIAPVIFFCSHIAKKKLISYFMLSGIIVFSYRYIYESYAPPTPISGLMVDLYHIYYVPRFLPVLFSPYGAYKMFSNLYIWMFVPIVAIFLIPSFVKNAWKRLDKTMLWFVGSVMVQMLLSVSIERMFYVAMPVLCLFVAYSLSELKKIYMKLEK